MNDTLSGDWLTETAHSAPAEPPPAPAQRSRLLTTVGAVATAAVLAAGGTYALTHSSSTASNAAAVGGAPNGAMGARPGGAAGGAGGGMGFAPTQFHLDGTITAIGASTVTVETTAGTTTYSVTSSTHLLRNGATATLSQFAVGDSVRGSTTTQSGTVLNDLVAGLPAQGQGQPPTSS